MPRRRARVPVGHEAARAAAAAAAAAKQPPPAPPPLPRKFSECWRTKNYIRVETEENMIQQASFADFDIALQGNNNEQKQHQSGIQRSIVAFERNIPGMVQVNFLPVVEESRRDGAESSGVFCCTACAITADLPNLFTTHDEWQQHRQTKEHQRQVRALTELRLVAEMERIYEAAEEFVKKWDAHGNPLIATGRVYFDFGCPEHSPQKVRCPSFMAVVEGLSDSQFNDPKSVTREPIRLLPANYRFGFHGCRGSAALAAINCQNLDPKRRAANAYGPGEYSGLSAMYSVNCSGDADRMLVILNIVNPLLSNPNQKQFHVMNNPLDEPGKPKVRFCLPVLICQFVSQAMLPAGAQQQLGHQYHRHQQQQQQQQDQNQKAVEERKRVVRSNRITNELSALRNRAFLDRVFAQARPTTPIFDNTRTIVVDFILEPEVGDLKNAEIAGSLHISEQYPFAAPSAILFTPNGRLRSFTDVCLGVEDGWSPGTTISALLLGLMSIINSETNEFDAAATDPATVRRLARESRAANDRLGSFLPILRQNYMNAKVVGKTVFMAEQERRRLEQLAEEKRRKEQAEREEQQRLRRLQAEQERKQDVVIIDLSCEDEQPQQQQQQSKPKPKPVPKVKPAPKCSAVAAAKKVLHDDDDDDDDVIVLD